jgi:hypothetical protein
MTDDDLRSLLRGGEGSRVEFKASANRDKVKKTAVAFANRLWQPEPGVLFVGVQDDGTVTGVPNPDETIKDMRRYVEECFPPIDRWEVRPLAHEGLTVVALIVWESRDAPHFVGGAYVRRGSESIQASREMYEKLLAYRSSSARRLAPWIGRAITVEQRRMLATGRTVWAAGVVDRNLISVDEIGIVLDLGGGPVLRVDWGRVILQPDVEGRPPYVRIRD